MRLNQADRRALILHAAEQLFAEKGYAEASIDQIARRAGVSAPVLYDHFASKAELHLQLLRTRGPAIIRAVKRRIRAEDRPEARLRAGIDAFFTFVHEHPATWRLLFRDAPSEPAIARQARQQQARTTATLASILRASAGAWGEQQPDLDQATEIIAELIKSGLNGLAGWWWDHPDTPRDRLVDLVMATIWTGLQATQAPSETGVSRRDAGLASSKTKTSLT